MWHFNSFMLALVFSYIFASSAYADIYEYIDVAGVVHYSDFASNDEYVLIMKSPEAEVVAGTSGNGDSSAAVMGSDAIVLTPGELVAQIDASAQQNQLDSELIHAVIHVESAYKNTALSHKGAQGLMQLMPATAKRFGVSNSYDPKQNIEGGARYLRALLNLFNNNVSLAIAAYNAGEQAVIRYGNHIPPFRETQAYVPKVLNVYRALLRQKQGLAG